MMISIHDAAGAIGAQLRHGGNVSDANVMLSAVSSDTRAIAPGGLFIALRGARFDGHMFVPQAIAAGAVAGLVDRRFAGIDTVAAPLIVVDDTRRALERLAAWWRGRHRLPVIGVVGSNGKTTTKEMTRAILDAQFGAAQVLATIGNLNNDVGLPLTAMGLRPAHRAAVFEIGMNHPGETAALAEVAQCNVALINNAQREHQEFMPSVAAVAAEHGALLTSLPADGVAVLNQDDHYIDYWRDLAGARTVRSFGLDPMAQVTARYELRVDSAQLEIRMPEGSISTRLRVAGLHNVRNALAAAAAATAVGASIGAVAAGLAAFEPVTGRSVVKRASNGARVIDDSYNANPDSVRAAIDVLAQAAAPRVLVLGDMGEVGPHGETFHAEVGSYARDRGVDALHALGAATQATVEAFGRGATHYADIDALIAAVSNAASAASSTVLVKGSRFMRMERVVNALTGAAGGSH